MIRPATSTDVDDLARLHVQAWTETYRGLLPDSEIAARDLSVRQRQWQQMIDRGDTRIAYAPGAGFAQSGPQRDAELAAQGFAAELYALYLIDSAKGRGLGRALFDAVRPDTGFTALVLDSNGPANQFYERQGGRLLETRPEWVGSAPITERVYVWDAAVQL